MLIFFVCVLLYDLHNKINTIYISDCYAVIKVGNCILFNVYLPCVGSCHVMILLLRLMLGVSSLL